MRCQGRVGFPPTDPLSLWGDSLCLGLEGGAGSCSPSWALLLRALGVPHVSGHESHISEVIDVEAVGLFVTRPQVTAEGRVSPGVTSGTAQIFDIGQFLLLGTAGLFWKWQLTAAGSHVVDQPRNLFVLGENTLVSTEMAHQVRRDSAEVKGQDVVVVVGVGSLTGKTLIPSRAGRVLAAGVRVGLYSLLPVTVSIKGILPGLPGAAVVVPLAAAALELHFQPGQSVQLPLDGVSAWEVAWHRAEAFQVADVLDIVQRGYPGRERKFGAQRDSGPVAGAGPEVVVWLGSSLLEAAESSLPLPTTALMGSGLDRELGLTEPGHCVLPHKLCTF